MRKLYEAFAVWVVKDEPRDLNTINIGAGPGEDDDGTGNEGYFISDKGARIVVEKRNHGLYQVTFTAPARGLQRLKKYWLAPSLLDNDQEATDWGIRIKQNKGDK